MLDTEQQKYNYWGKSALIDEKNVREEANGSVEPDTSHGICEEFQSRWWLMITLELGEKRNTSGAAE